MVKQLKEIEKMMNEETMKMLYRKGYYDGVENTKRDFEFDLRKAREDGLYDAWEVARKIVYPIEYGGLTPGQLSKIFGLACTYDILKRYSATEAIEKIKEHESRVPDKDVGEIKVGDEVMYGTRKGVVSKVYSIENGAMNTLDIWLGSSVVVINADNNDLILTGKHYPQIAEVLEQMKEKSKEKCYFNDGGLHGECAFCDKDCEVLEQMRNESD